MCFNTVCENNSQMEYFRKALKTAGDSYILLFTRHHPFGGFLLCDNSSIHHFREDVLLFVQICSFIGINSIRNNFLQSVQIQILAE